MDPNKIYFSNPSQDQSFSNNKFDSKEDDDEKRRNKRRSKNDTDGRNHRCPTCGKSYLSYPALYTHIKQKHNTSGPTGRGRGRPKKDTGEPNSDRSRYNPLDFTYFDKEDRRGCTYSFEPVVKEVFNQIYSDTSEIIERNSQKKIKCYDSVYSHPFLNKLMHHNNDYNVVLEPETSKSDEVFTEYLVKVATLVRPEYFTHILKFVTLFREYVNIAYKDRIKPGDGDYTQLTNAEDVPDVSNEFITEFIDPEQNSFDFSKEEIIELTQNICNWMYENNYTCSKLSLVNQ